MVEKSHKRDNFKANVVRMLRDRVGHRCSNPVCRVPTSSPGDGKNGVNNIGVAAHIYAASPNGPRYLATMSSAERSSFDNGIWLCSTCSYKIDRSPSDYPAELLREWKAESEARAKEELGMRLPSNDDAVNQIESLFTGKPTGFLATSIHNVHKATASSLESLDERFGVTVSHVDGKSIFKIEPKSSKVSVSFQLVSDSSYDFSGKHQALVSRGEGFDIPASHIISNDSKLFDKILSQGGVVSISPIRFPAVIKMYVKCPESNVVEMFDDAHGHLTPGTEIINFDAKTFSGLFHVRGNTGIPRNESKASLSFDCDFSLWEGMDVARLPYLVKLYTLFDRMLKGWLFSFAIEVQGERLATSDDLDVSGFDFVKEIVSFLLYSKSAMKLARASDKKVKFDSNITYSGEDLDELVMYSGLFDKPGIFGSDELRGDPSFTLTLNKKLDGFLKESFEKEDGGEVLITQSGVALEVFNDLVPLPDIKRTFGPVKLNPNVDVEKAKPGDSVVIRCERLEGFEMKIEYL